MECRTEKRNRVAPPELVCAQMSNAKRIPMPSTQAVAATAPARQRMPREGSFQTWVQRPLTTPNTAPAMIRMTSIKTSLPAVGKAFRYWLAAKASNTAGSSTDRGVSALGLICRKTSRTKRTSTM